MPVPETWFERFGGVVLVMLSLGCFMGGGETLMPHLSGGSSEKSCDPDGAGCSRSGEVCVYNPWIIEEDGVDLNGYKPWVGSECGEAPDDEGVCVQRPSAGAGDYPRPVCGCDGETYESPAAAHHDGVSIDYFGACRPLQPHIDEENSSLQECDRGEGDCSGGEKCILNPFLTEGTEEHVQTKCVERDTSTRVEAGTYSNGNGDEDFNPRYNAFCVELEDNAASKSWSGDDSQVCGCDGNTYASYADAHAAGVSVSKQAACDESSGIEFCNPDNADSCPPTEFCKVPQEDSCGDYGSTGTCVVPPSNCATGYNPVCGCDGTTYRNECVAHSSEVSVASTGECQSPTTTTAQ